MQTRKQKFFLLFILLLGCIVTSIFWPKEKESIQLMDKSSLVADSDGSIEGKQVMHGQVKRKRASLQIYVSGAVQAPGIYQLEDGARAQDAIEAAGGLREDANLERVNLARKLKDGYQVNVPSLRGNKTSTNRSYNSYNQNSTSSKTIQNAQPIGVNGINKDGNIESPTYGDSVTISSKVDINHASESELQRLPGVGPSMAQRIVAERSKRHFSSLTDLKRVKGIGDAKLAKMQEYIVVR